MDKPPIRRLNLSDLVILVAASAFGVLILRTEREVRATGMNITRHLVPSWTLTIGLEVSPFLLPTAAGLLIARLLRPRPPWRRIFRQPGVVACLTILVSMASFILLRFGDLLTAKSKGIPTIGFEIQFFLWNSMFTGKDVALAWSILALARAWRPEPSWIDRAGRGFGFLSILLWLARALFL